VTSLTTETNLTCTKKGPIFIDRCESNKIFIPLNNYRLEK